MKREQVIEYINQMLDKLPMEKLMMIYRILIRISSVVPMEGKEQNN